MFEHAPGNHELAKNVYERVREKLKQEAVEDFRIDFEDGFGHRPDAEEDEAAAILQLRLRGCKLENFRVFGDTHKVT